MLHPASEKLHCQILFHHDNGPEHTAKTATTILREFCWEIHYCREDMKGFPSETLVKLLLQSWPCVLEHCHDGTEFDNGAFQMLDGA